MFHFEDISDLDKDWYLGDPKKHAERIPKDVLKCISNFHLLGIQFLYANYMKKKTGVILNEDEDMNVPLQVCTFLNSFKDQISLETPILIICPENLLCKWHYHLNDVGFTPKIVSNEDFETCKVNLLTIELLKLLGKFTDLSFFCTVIDEFDTIANKVIIRKVCGSFKIGITKRNFYINPDQKLRWTMLNWVSPRCVGKLKDFYSIDRLHSLAFADNYRFWWFRLTWKYCESFEKPNNEDKEEYEQTLVEYGKIHGIQTNFIPTKQKIRKRKVFTINENTEIKSKRKYIKKKPFNRNLLMENNVPKNKSVDDDHLDDEIIIIKKPKIRENDESNMLVSKMENNVPKNKSVDDDHSITKTKPKILENNVSNMIISNIKEHVDEFVLDEKDESNLEILADKTPEKRIKTELNLEVEEEPTINDSLFSLQSPSNNDKSESDYEDPLISIINSQPIEITKTENNLNDEFKKLIQTSESDSDFLTDFVEKKTDSSRSFRSKQISQILDNLSDMEIDNQNNDDDDDDFLAKFISG